MRNVALLSTNVRVAQGEFWVVVYIDDSEEPTLIRLNRVAGLREGATALVQLDGLPEVVLLRQDNRFAMGKFEAALADVLSHEPEFPPSYPPQLCGPLCAVIQAYRVIQQGEVHTLREKGKAFEA